MNVLFICDEYNFKILIKNEGINKISNIFLSFLLFTVYIV